MAGTIIMLFCAKTLYILTFSSVSLRSLIQAHLHLWVFFLLLLDLIVKPEVILELLTEPRPENPSPKKFVKAFGRRVMIFGKLQFFSAPASPSSFGTACRVQAALQLAALGAPWQVSPAARTGDWQHECFFGQYVLPLCYQVSTQRLERRPLIPSRNFRSRSVQVLSALLKYNRITSVPVFDGLMLPSRQVFLSRLFLINGNLSLSFLFHVFFLFLILYAAICLAAV